MPQAPQVERRASSFGQFGRFSAEVLREPGGGARLVEAGERLDVPLELGRAAADRAR